MDMSVISEVVLPVVFVVVGIALIWLLVELVMFLRHTRSTIDAMEAQVTPLLKDAKEITESIKPAVDKVDPLVERVSLAVDAANLEIMRLDGILENVGKITETTASAANAVDTVANTPLKLVNSATEKLRSAFSVRKASEESASLARSAESEPFADAPVDGLSPHGEADAFPMASGSDAACEPSRFEEEQEAERSEADLYFTYASDKED